MDALDNVPVATPTFLAGLVCIVIAYVSNDVSIEDAFELLGLLGAGSFGIGYVRNQAGKGVRK
jgi:hypothetical protein